MEFIERDLVVGAAKLRIKQSLLSDRPPLVFLHDSLGCITLWRDFPQRLAQAVNCGVLIYDRQGYGQSSPFTSTRTSSYLEQEAEVLIQLLQALEIRSSITFGHSDGGSIALLAAAKRPELFAAVISEGAHVFVEDITLAGIRDTQELYRTTDLKERLTKYHGASTDAVFSAWADIWLSAPYRSWNMENWLPAVHCPVLVIQGEADEFGTVAQVDAIVQQVSGPAKKLMVQGKGHTPHRDAPDLVLDAATRFINQMDV